MAILKSEIIGKSIGELSGSLVNSLHADYTAHKIWTKTSTKAIDFLSRCTLRYNKSYGASYKIDPTSELTIIHTDGAKYPVDSYKKLLTMVITDYDEPQEQPMPTQPQPGTHWERLETLTTGSPKGEIVTILDVTRTNIHFSNHRDLDPKVFLERFKPRPDLDTPASEPTIRRRLAFYKASGKPWTYDEYVNISNYCDDKLSERQLSRFNDPSSYKYVYDDGDTSDFMYNWHSRKPEEDPEDYTILSYESVFETSTTKPISTKTTKPKTKPVAQPESIQPITKEKPMAPKPTIKDTAATLITANKDAAILAAKLEAGKILNKQVIKLIKPKLHPLVRGYADSPLASVVLANVVGFAIKQYAGDNAKAGQLAEMMLQASAVESVSALNIEGLIDDLLSSVKLPKSVRAELNDIDEDYE